MPKKYITSYVNAPLDGWMGHSIQKGACQSWWLPGAFEMETNVLRCFCVTACAVLMGLLCALVVVGINQWKTLKVTLKDEVRLRPGTT